MNSLITSTIYKRLDDLVDDIVGACKDKIEFVAVISNELSIITSRSSRDIDRESLEAFNAVIISIVLHNIQLFNFREFNKIVLLLRDGRYLIVKRYHDYYLACLSTPGSRLGFIEMVLEHHLSDSFKKI